MEVGGRRAVGQSGGGLKTKAKNLPRRSRLAQGQGAADLMTSPMPPTPFFEALML